MWEYQSEYEALTALVRAVPEFAHPEIATALLKSESTRDDKVESFTLEFVRLVAEPIVKEGMVVRAFNANKDDGDEEELKEDAPLPPPDATQQRGR